ncbi:MAG: transcriptional regulator [Segetibacter sp.]|nr:transcriptional regulator [Segetibacter sp.]
MNVLFVQERPTLSSALQLIFNRNGYQVIFCSNADEAVEIIQQNKPSLVVANLIPSKTGLAFIAQVKKNNIPVIVMTSVNNEDYLQDAFDMGADDFIPMPMSISEVYLRVNKLTRSRLAGQA